jgi:hypothetical protein
MLLPNVPSHSVLQLIERPPFRSPFGKQGLVDVLRRVASCPAHDDLVAVLVPL